ncbi:unnamed protein product, partial [Oncorhynchus mykiss]
VILSFKLVLLFTCSLSHVRLELPTCKDVDFRNNMQKVYMSEEKERIMDKLNRDVESGAEISTVHPEQYAKRFHEFIAEIFA